MSIRQKVYGFIIVALLLLGILIWSVNRDLQAARPRSNEFFEFIRLAPVTQITRVELLDIGTNEYIEIIGERPSILASGPPAYIFDASGQLVDWTSDDGEDPRFQRAWGSPTKRTPATIEYAAELVKQKKLSNSTKPSSNPH